MTNVSDMQLDPSIRPQDDFFNYVNKKWLDRHPIPDSEVSWGTFNVLRDTAWRAMRDIYEGLQGHEFAVGSVEQQARDFYASGIHYNDFEDVHLTQLRTLLQKVDAIKDTTQLSRALGELNAMRISSPLYVWVDADQEDSSRHIFHFSQGGLTLPDRDYYLEQTEPMKKIRKAYEAYAKNVYEHFPELATSASALWESLLDFETKLASISRSSVALRDIEKNFNRTTFSDLQKHYAHVDWQVYAEALGWTLHQPFSVDQPEFLGYINDAFAEVPLTTWKMYLKWRITNACLTKISDAYAELHFSFFGATLNGTKELLPLWKRVVLAMDNCIGDATGQLYIQKHFPESSKQAVLQLVEDVREAYGERLDTLDWMSDKTKKYARQKLANMKVLIGYPDTWRDFSGLQVRPDSYLGNVMKAAAFEMTYELNKLREPTSRDDWFMTPQTVNAYHDPTRLVICFPAAILQKPFFDPDASLAANMGGIGTVIGHELSHGFDDQGCQFDAHGNVRTWQTAKERKTFAKKAQVIVDQADAFHVLPDLTLKGQLVLGESIADLGGIEIALHALKKKLESSDTRTKDFLAPIQQFFLSYAFTECNAIREEKLREYTLSDWHPASEYRVNGILQHVDDFYIAFDIQPSDALYRSPDTRARIW
jgi:putative endopeptidase